MIFRKRKKYVITGRSDRDMYINVRKQLGKDGFMNTWQLSERERGIIHVVIIKAYEKNWESGRSKLSRIFSWVRITQLD